MAAPITVITHPRRDNPTTIADRPHRCHIRGVASWCHICRCRIAASQVLVTSHLVVADRVRRAYSSVMTSQTPNEITVAFLDALSRSDLDAAMADLDDNIAYTNVSLPTAHGKKQVAAILGTLTRWSWVSFNYRMVNVAAADTVVLTERIDELRLGRLVLQFWVCGRFEVREGRIVVWRDYFDYFDMTKAVLRGVVGIVASGLIRPLPAHPLNAVNH